MGRAGADNIQAGRPGDADGARGARARTAPWSVTSGVDGLTILKTTKSAFTGYIKDKLTTLKPATDRIFGTRATVDVGLRRRRCQTMQTCVRAFSQRC